MFITQIVAGELLLGAPVLRGLAPDGVAEIGTDLAVAINGEPPAGSIQWTLDGAPIPGETGAALTVPAAEDGTLGVVVDGQLSMPARILYPAPFAAGGLADPVFTVGTGIQTVDTGADFSFSGTLRYTLRTGPAGVEIDPDTGQLRFDTDLMAPQSGTAIVIRAEDRFDPLRFAETGLGFDILPGVAFDIHVDAIAGDDAGDGGPETPVRSLARAAALALGFGNGVRIGLQAGSVWRETLDLAELTGVQLRGMGDLATDGLPFVNAANTLGGFQTSADRGDGLANTYSVLHAHEAPAGQAAAGPSVFEDGDMLTWVADAATVDATPGSFTHDGADSGASPVTLYIHPTGSGDPAANGRLYEASARTWAVRAGDDAHICNLRAAHQLHDNGAINFGHRGLVEGCLVHGSPIHDALGASGEYRNCIAWHPQSDPRTGAIALEFYTDAPFAGMTGRWQGCVVAGPPDAALPRPASLDGIGGHTAGTGPQYAWSVENCALYGCDLILNDVSDLSLNQVKIWNGRADFAPLTQATDVEIVADRRFETGNDIGVDASLWTTGIADGLRLSVPADFNAGIKDGAGGQITGSILHINAGADGSAAGAARCVRLTGNGDAIGITGSILDSGTGVGNNLVQTVASVTLANDDNVLWELADGTKYFLPDGSPKGNLAAVQAAGLELNSIELDPGIAAPLSGDWTVSGAVGDWGLDRPQIVYLPRPVSLFMAEAQVLGISPVPPLNLAVPQISGSATVPGDPLSADTGTWSNIDGITSYSYQWARDGVPIAGATAADYVVDVADGGTALSVIVTATNGAGATSANSAGLPVPTFTVPLISAPPVISGIEEVGQTLSATPGPVSGNPDPSDSWQWFRNGTPITGASAAAYLLTVADAGAVLTVRQIATNAVGSATEESAPTDPIAGSLAPQINAIAVGSQAANGDLPVSLDLTADGQLRYVMTENAAAPSVPQIGAGQDEGGSAALVAGTITTTGNGLYSGGALTVGLDGTGFHLHAYIGSSDGTSGVASAGPFALDTLPALLSAPLASATGSGTADWSVTTDTGAGVIHAGIRPAAAAPLSAAELIAGAGGAGIAWSSDPTPQAGAGNGGSFTGLAGDTAYRVDMVQVDERGNIGLVATSDPLTTDAATITTLFTDAADFDNGATNMTGHGFPGLAIGAPAASREVHVLVGTAEFGSSPLPNAVSIGGVAATRAGTVTLAGSGTLSHWHAALPAGTSAEITVTGTMRALGVAVYASYGRAPGPSVSDAGATQTVLSLDQTTLDGDDLIAAAMSFDETGFAWTGLGEDHEADIRSNEYFSAASASGAAAATPRTITPALTSGSGRILGLSVRLR